MDPVTIPTPPGARAFSTLAIGTTFEFDHAGLAHACNAFMHGPWRKISARTYDRADVPPHPGTGAYRVGSVAVRVRLDDCGGG